MSTIESENKMMTYLMIKHNQNMIGVIASDIINCNDDTKLKELRSKLQSELSRFIANECK